ncbi:MAG: methionine--tRNA ligase [Deltaproteobacteria bacterium]|nr:methionine--tRNA ligase [Deltaproteobacteria bacterium]
MELPYYDFFESSPETNQDNGDEVRVIFVAWPYMNGKLHVGHLAGYLIPADVIARAFRMRRFKTLMVSGSDCYGTPILLTAFKEKVTPWEVVSFYHEEALKLFRLLKLTFDNYTATVNKTHHEVVKWFFVEILRNGFFEKGKDRQFFSPSLSRFVPDRFVIGECPYCKAKEIKSDQCEECSAVLLPEQVINPVSIFDNKPVELRESEHYFLAWPKLQSEIQNYFELHRSLWRPWVVSETEKWLREGLKKRAVTRDLDWGIEIPVDKIDESLRLADIHKKRIYVWFEAVTGYYSSTVEYCLRKGLEVDRFWKNPKARHYYFMGKDNLPFHTIFWPGQLIATRKDFLLPYFPAINQYLLFGTDKFSKSKGRIVDSYDFTNKYGTDYVRFYFSAFAPEASDFSFSEEHFKEQCNSLLVDKVGNFVSRVSKLAGLDFRPILSFEAFLDFEPFLKKYIEATDKASTRELCQAILDFADFLNKDFTDKRPWSFERGSHTFQVLMSKYTGSIILLLNILKPLIPDAISRAEKQFNLNLTYLIDSKELFEKELSSFKINALANMFEKI